MKPQTTPATIARHNLNYVRSCVMQMENNTTDERQAAWCWDIQEHLSELSAAITAMGAPDV